MSKKKKNTFKKILSILACVALLAITVIPVNNLYAEDDNTTGNEQQTQENYDAENNNEEIDNQEDDQNSDPQKDLTANEGDGTYTDTPELSKGPQKTSNKMLEVSIKDENDKIIAFDSNEAAVFKPVDLLTQSHYYPLYFEFNFDPDNFHAQYDIVIENDFGVTFVQIGDTDRQLEQALDKEKGNNGISVEYLLNTSYEGISASSPRVIENGPTKVTYHLKPSLEKLTLDYDSLLFSDASYLMQPNELHKEAIIVSLVNTETNEVIEKHTVDISCKHDMTKWGIHNSSTNSYIGYLDRRDYPLDLAIRNYPTYQVGYSPEYIYGEKIVGKDTYRTPVGKYTISLPENNNYNGRIKATDAELFLLDTSIVELNRNYSLVRLDSTVPDQTTAEYILYTYPGSYATCTIDTAEQKPVALGVYFPSDKGFKVDDSVEIKIESEIQLYDKESENKKYKVPIEPKTITVKVAERNTNSEISVNTSSSPAGTTAGTLTITNNGIAAQDNATALLERFQLYNKGAESDEKTIEMVFDTKYQKVQGFLAYTMNNNRSFEFTITTNQYPDGKTVKVSLPDMNYKKHYIDNQHNQKGRTTAITLKNLGLELDDYLISVKYNTKIAEEEALVLPFYGTVHQNGTAENKIAVYDIDKNAEDVSSTGWGITNVTYDPQERYTGSSAPSVNAISVSGGDTIVAEIETTEGGRVANNYVGMYNPILHVIINLKDGKGEHLTLTKLYFRNRYLENEEAPWTEIDINKCDSIIDYEDFGRVYTLDTAKLVGEDGLPLGHYIGGIDANGALYDSALQIKAEIKVPLGSPKQSTSYMDMFVFEDKTVNSGKVTDGFTKYENISKISPRDLDNKPYNATTLVRLNVNQPISITPYHDFQVQLSAKHESADKYIVWEEGKDPIAIGNKSAFDIKVDVINGSEEKITGPASIYIPIPKLNQSWGVLQKGNFGFDIQVTGADIDGKTKELEPDQYSIKYGNVTPTDVGTTLDANTSWTDTFTADSNCIKIVVKNLPANNTGEVDTYSFIFKCKMMDGTIERELVNTWRPLFYKTTNNAAFWETNGPLISLISAIGEVRGQLFLDEDRDGKFDADEALALSDVEVILYNGSDEIAKTKTDSNGKYLFYDLNDQLDTYYLTASIDTSKYEFTQLGTHSTRNKWNTDNQFSAESNSAALGKSQSVSPESTTSSTQDTEAVYNIGLLDANSKTKITFKANGGKFADNKDVKVVEGRPSENIPAVSVNRTGHSFSHWYLETDQNEAAVTLGKYDYEHRTYVAKWTENTYDIDYELNGGSNHADNPSTYKTADTPIVLKDASKKYYDFVEWQDEDGKATTGIAANSEGDRKFTAIFTATKYRIDYEMNKGTNHTSNPKEYTYESEQFSLQEPTRNGYEFLGWTGTGITGTQPQKEVVISAGSSGDREYTANWRIVQYDIEYKEVEGATNNNPAKYTVEELPLTLNNPTKTGYNFTGWTTSVDDTQPKLSVTIPKETTGNLTFIANWDPITYKIVFDGNKEDSGVDPDPITVKYGETVYAPANPYSKDTYKFDAWVDNYGNEYQEGDDLSKITTEDNDTVTLKPIWYRYECVAGNNQVWTKGSKANVTLTFKRKDSDGNDRKDKATDTDPGTYDNFVNYDKQFLVDGTPLTKPYIETTEGSLIVFIKPEYLETLKAGKHTAIAMFGRGEEATATFTVKDSSGGKTYYIPKTGVE